MSRGFDRRENLSLNVQGSTIYKRQQVHSLAATGCSKQSPNVLQPRWEPILFALFWRKTSVPSGNPPSRNCFERAVSDDVAGPGRYAAGDQARPKFRPCLNPSIDRFFVT